MFTLYKSCLTGLALSFSILALSILGLSIPALLIPTSALAAGAGAGKAPVFHSPPGAEDADLPFSDVVQVGRWLFLAGKIGNIPGTRDLAHGGIQGETRQAMNNIKASLAHHGASMDDIVKCTVFLADMAEWSAMNEVYVTFFGKHKPARSAVGVNGLALGARTEIECMAVLPGKE